VSQEYVNVLRVLLDHAPHHPFEEIESVFVQDFGKPSSELFKEISKEPLAAASLAQVRVPVR
jgi:ubiquinone biosynthesis protein